MGPWGSTATEGDAMAGIYHYDQLNRLKSMATRQGITAAANNWATIPAPTSLKAYMSQYTYDGNGNILTVQRQDGNGNTYDSLLYHYKKSGAQLLQNRLYHLQDLADHNNSLVNPGAGEQAQDIGYDNSAYMDAAFEAVEQDNNYRYDALGNLVKDRRESIDTITWTVAGKVAAVVHASSPDSLKFTYGADGQRTSKTLGDPEQGGYREYYIRDAQGNIMAVYLYKALGTSSTLLLQDRPIYGSKRVGSYGEAEEMLSGPLPPNYAHPMLSALLKYELTDHLGNVRATVSGELIPSANSASMYEPHLLSETDYEPFGSLLPGRNYSSDSYRFGFNGKLKDDEVHGATGTSYDYGFRMYDSRIGRFVSIDPLTAKYPFYSPTRRSGARGLKKDPGARLNR
jgi:RHS repeat-associated protein